MSLDGFAFLNELNFVPEDSEELEAMDGRGINADEVADDEDEHTEKDEFSDDASFEDEEFDSKEDY